MATLGRQVGQYTERRRADEAMLVSEAVKDGIVRTALDSLADRWGTARHGRACIWFERDLR